VGIFVKFISWQKQVKCQCQDDDNARFILDQGSLS